MKTIRNLDPEEVDKPRVDQDAEIREIVKEFQKLPFITFS